MMGVIVTAIEPDTAFSIWDRVRDMIDIGYAVGDDKMPTDILEQIRYGKVLLWNAIDDENGNIVAAMTTELVPMRSGLVCWMCQCGGDRMQDWKHFHVKIEEYAKAEGCVKVILKGRRGWERVLEGYRVRTVTLEKIL
jgi:hypothetical protein